MRVNAYGCAVDYQNGFSRVSSTFSAAHQSRCIRCAWSSRSHRATAAEAEGGMYCSSNNIHFHSFRPLMEGQRGSCASIMGAPSSWGLVFEALTKAFHISLHSSALSLHFLLLRLLIYLWVFVLHLLISSWGLGLAHVLWWPFNIDGSIV